MSSLGVQVKSRIWIPTGEHSHWRPIYQPRIILRDVNHIVDAGSMTIVFPLVFTFSWLVVFKFPACFAALASLEPLGLLLLLVDVGVTQF